MTNQLIMQAFEWYLPADGNHWKTVKASIPQLQHLGVTELWLPLLLKELVLMMWDMVFMIYLT